MERRRKAEESKGNQKRRGEEGSQGGMAFRKGVKLRGPWHELFYLSVIDTRSKLHARCGGGERRNFGGSD